MPVRDDGPIGADRITRERDNALAALAHPARPRPHPQRECRELDHIIVGIIAREGALLERGRDGRAASHSLRPGSTITPIIRRQHPLGGPGKPDVFGAQPSAPPFDIAAP